MGGVHGSAVGEQKRKSAWQISFLVHTKDLRQTPRPPSFRTDYPDYADYADYPDYAD